MKKKLRRRQGGTGGADLIKNRTQRSALNGWRDRGRKVNKEKKRNWAAFSPVSSSAGRGDISQRKARADTQTQLAETLTRMETPLCFVLFFLFGLVFFFPAYVHNLRHSAQQTYEIMMPGSVYDAGCPRYYSGTNMREDSNQVP